LRAASSVAVVTMFHPARPLLTWSREANRRARLYGELYEVDAVAMSPMRSVTPANTVSSVRGSRNAERSTADVAVELRLVREEERVERAAFSNPGEVRVVATSVAANGSLSVSRHDASWCPGLIRNAFRCS
jgi:hypothetical protein